MQLLELLIKSSVMGAGPSSWPTFNGRTVARMDYLTASEATNCIRQLSFNKLSEHQSKDWDLVMTDDQFSMLVASQSATSPDGYFQRGHNIEAWIVEQLQAGAAENEKFIFLGDDQVSFYDEVTRVSGTPDGIFYDVETKEMWLLEFKSVGSQVYSARSNHINQTQVNMGLIEAISVNDKPGTGDVLLALLEEAGVELVDGRLPDWSGAMLLYVQSSNYFDQKEFHYDYDDGLAYATAVKRAKQLFSGDEEQINQLRRPSSLVAEGVAQNKCAFCDHKKACAHLIKIMEGEEAAREMLAEHIPMALPDFKSTKTKSALVKMALDYVEADIEIKDRQKAQKQIKDEVSAFVLVDCSGKLEMECSEGVGKIMVRENAGRTTLDKDKLGQAGIDLDQYEKVGKPFFTTSVKVG
jgi:hypothetical protein